MTFQEFSHLLTQDKLHDRYLISAHVINMNNKYLYENIANVLQQLQ